MLPATVVQKMQLSPICSASHNSSAGAAASLLCPWHAIINQLSWFHQKTQGKTFHFASFCVQNVPSSSTIRWSKEISGKKTATRKKSWKMIRKKKKKTGSVYWQQWQRAVFFLFAFLSFLCGFPECLSCDFA